MKRRTVLAGSAALALTSLLPVFALGRSPRPLRRIRPNDAAWPDASAWQQLNTQCGGNLIKVEKLFHECAAAENDACRDAMKNIQNPFYIGDQLAGTQVSGWQDAWSPAPSVYAVRARNAADVSAAVTFARRNNIRVAIKGGGHSYLGTSNAPDSLLIWTRAMNDIRLHDDFVPAGCAGRAAPAPAVSVGAGCMWIDAYTTVTTRAGRYVQGGGCTSVGVAGLIQSGGFGSFSKRFGSAASGLLEAEIVTADGRIRIVNACRDPELFWAIKGGGGGTFGVVTRLTLRTHDLPPHFGGAGGKIKAASDDAFRRLVARAIDFYAEALFNPHWGEQISVSPDNVLKISMVSQGLDSDAARAAWKPFVDWVAASPNEYKWTDDFGAGSAAAQHWWDADYRRMRGNTSLINDARPGTPPHHAFWDGDKDQCSAYLYGYESLWMPASLLAPGQRARLTDALFAASRHEGVELHFNKGLAGAPREAIAAARDTAMNPKVCDAFALAIVADGRAPLYPLPGLPPRDDAAGRKAAADIHAATEELRKVAPNGGSYVSESNFFEPDWQHSYWGANYARLSAVKRRYDPEGSFTVHNGVGSEAWSADGFTRVG